MIKTTSQISKDEQQAYDTLLSLIPSTQSLEQLIILNTLAKFYFKATRTEAQLKTDRYLGRANSTHYKEFLANARKHGLTLLDKDVSTKQTAAAQLQALADAKEMKFFSEHRENHIVTGAYGETGSVKAIKDRMAYVNSHQSLFCTFTHRKAYPGFHHGTEQTSTLKK